MICEVVDTRCANVASMMSALKRKGLEARLCASPEKVSQAAYVVLPGVGTFGAAMMRLNELGMADTLKERIVRGAPTLCVCVGFQVLFESSEESEGVRGLCVFKGTVQHFPSDVRVPQFGWNIIRPQIDDALIKEGYGYFANSYFASDPPDGFSWASSEHGRRFISAVHRDGVLGCQFHPELSSDFGLELIERWIERGKKDAC